jgi:type I restriction enzyme R subunit
MIGRGSRLRPDLFGPDQDKTHFLIFDLCGNFEFFTENPKGIEASAQKSITEIVFNLRLQLAEYLKEGQFTNNPVLIKFRSELLDQLFQDVSSLDHNRFDVRMKLKQVLDYAGGNRELWNHLDRKDINIIENVLAPLVKPSKSDSDLARFYDKLLYTLMIKRLEIPQIERFMDDFIGAISKVGFISKQLLRKTAIPEVKKKEELIKLPLDQLFWKNDGIKHLEEIRNGIRELVKYIDFEDQKYVTSNFEDQLYVKAIDEMNDPNISDNKAIYANNKYRLEEIIRNNSHHITIGRIRKGEPITESELKELETILFSTNLDKTKVEDEIGKQLNLIQFIINLMGLDEEKVNQAFADFINEFQLNSIQIEFLDTIKLFLTKNGKIDPSKLYDSPFKNYHSMGIDGVFDEQQSSQIFKIIESFNDSSNIA